MKGITKTCVELDDPLGILSNCRQRLKVPLGEILCIRELPYSVKYRDIVIVTPEFKKELPVLADVRSVSDTEKEWMKISVSAEKS